MASFTVSPKKAPPAPWSSSRSSPEKPVSPADARSTQCCATTPRPFIQPHLAYNLCLSEMRHYKDDDTLVLVMSQRPGVVEEAEYPIPLSQDTSLILDAEEDDVLAGYSEAAAKLVRPNPFGELRDVEDEDGALGASSRLPMYDDALHERFHSETYAAEMGKNGATATETRLNSGKRPTSSSDELRGANADSADSPRGFFSSTEPAAGSGTWSPNKAVVDDQPWMQASNQSHSNGNGRSHNGSDRSGQHQGRRGGHNGVRVHNGARPPASSSSPASRDTTASPFFPSTQPAYPAEERARTAPNSPDGQPSGAQGAEQTAQPSTFFPSGPAAPRVSNGVTPKPSRAQLREHRAAGRSRDAEVDSTAGAQHSPSNSPPTSHTATGIPTEARERAQADGSGPAGASGAAPFFPAANRDASRSSARASAQFQWERPEGLRSFFDANPTQSAAGLEHPASPQEHFAGTAQQPPQHSSQSSAPVSRVERVDQQESISTARSSGSQAPKLRQPPAPASGTVTTGEQRPRGSPGSPPAAPGDGGAEGEGRDGDSVEEQLEREDASRAFARAVSHSSFPSALPEHSIRSRSSPRNSATRRSSRRDAHMQARIARLDTSNLSSYSVPTLRRLAKDMGLSNIARLSKSELVVQLVSEIILANMSLGWGAPEVSQGMLSESESDEDGYTSSDDEDATVYRFGDEGSDGEVEIEEAVCHESLQRGRDTAHRLSREHHELNGNGASSSNGSNGAGVSAGGGGAAAAKYAQQGLQQVDVDADFESLSKLTMLELQQLCEEIGVKGWARMRKFEMISALLLGVYEIER